MSDTEFPLYDSCQPCAVLKPVRTQIGSGYACPVCQMTYIQTSRGAFIPFDQAYAMVKREQKKRAALERKKKR